MLSKDLIRIVGVTTQDECREMSEILAKLAEQPRGPAWRAMIRHELSKLPDQPESDLAQTIGLARGRITAEEDELRRTGWHPDQMKAKLIELGYSGLAPIERRV